MSEKRNREIASRNGVLKVSGEGQGLTSPADKTDGSYNKQIYQALKNEDYHQKPMLLSDTKPHDLLPPLLEAPVPHLLSLLAGGVPRQLIALVGLPGAGKTTLAARLAAEVNAIAGADTMIVLGMDGFHLTRAQLAELPNPEEALRRRGAPWTFDAHALACYLECVRLAAGRAPIWWPDFQHEVGDPIANVHQVPPGARLVLVEGLYLLHQGDGWDEVRRQFDEAWCLDTPPEVALERLTQRHMRAWNLTREAAQQRIAANDQFNAQTVLESCPNADWRIAD